jgi:hypothetical protein
LFFFKPGMLIYSVWNNLNLCIIKGLGCRIGMRANPFEFWYMIKEGRWGFETQIKAYQSAVF